MCVRVYLCACDVVRLCVCVCQRVRTYTHGVVCYLYLVLRGIREYFCMFICLFARLLHVCMYVHIYMHIFIYVS